MESGKRPAGAPGGGGRGSGAGGLGKGLDLGTGREWGSGDEGLPAAAGLQESRKERR